MLRLRLRKVPSPGGYCLLRIPKEELSLSKERSRFRMCRSFIASQDPILREADQESNGKVS